MRTVLLEQPERKATTSELSEEIAKRGLYHLKDGEAARASQVNARARKNPKLFDIANGMIGLKGNPQAN
jgi:hypothetical protein